MDQIHLHDVIEILRVIQLLTTTVLLIKRLLKQRLK